MTVHVVDESCPERRHAIQIVIFYPRIDQMPRVLVRIRVGIKIREAD